MDACDRAARNPPAFASSGAPLHGARERSRIRSLTTGKYVLNSNRYAFPGPHEIGGHLHLTHGSLQRAFLGLES